MEKIIQILLLSFWATFMAVSCADENPSIYSLGKTSTSMLEPEEGLVGGLVYVHATGKKTFLGTNIQSAKMLERPQMGVEFTYDFYIGRHEVICKDFNNVMAGATGLNVMCLQDSLPAANVTFYDAILYANALSKLNGMDTAYKYSSMELDAERHCVKMKNFKFQPKANGFRLPTEAEWVLVASEIWNPAQSWNGENSGSVVHPVCSSMDAQKSVCDMAGNMLELVNDRFASFKDTVVSNFAGSVDGDAIGSCVVKGGSFYMSPTSMNLYSRGDTYPILSSTKGDYLGFRLALGAIPDVTWFSEDGEAETASINPLVETADMLKLVESYRAKLVFRNDMTGGLVYVNFAKTPKVVQINDGIEVYHPEISPDGNHVAFSTSMEGSTKKSSVYVRDLNETGSNLVMLSVANAAIPRWRVNPNGDTVIVYVTSAGNNKSDQFLQESTWQVKFSNGRFGTPEKLFDGAYHGGVSKDNLVAISSAPLLRARLSDGITSGEVILYNGEQACNASLSKDGTNRTLFLDFAGSAGREFVGANYGVHERMLVMDGTGTLVQSIPAPAGYTLDHTEWVVGILKDGTNNLVVATLTDYNGNHQKVVLIDLVSGNIVPLVEGAELWHPCLWVWQDNPNVAKPVVNLDSAGVYFNSEDQGPFPFASVELAMRLQSFWKKNENVEVITFGSSMLLNAVIEDSLKPFNALNMGVSMTDIYLSEYLINHYVIPYAPKIRYLVVELSPGFLYRDYESMTGQLRNSSPGMIYDELHLSKATQKEIAELSAAQEYPMALLGQQYLEGTFLLPSGEWGVPVVNVDISAMPFGVPNVQNSLKVFESLKRLADSCGVTLIAAIPPRNPGYKDTGAFDPYGPSWEVAHQIIDAVKAMGIVIFDEYKDGHHDYTDAMAFNPNHVSYLGAAQFSARLEAFLETLK